jgi:hypothetical protein
MICLSGRMAGTRNTDIITRGPVQAGEKTNTLGRDNIMAKRMTTGILLPFTPINILVPTGKINYISLPHQILWSIKM